MDNKGKAYFISEDKHQFIYAKNGKEREQFLKDMVKKYPVKLNSKKPIGIYLDSIGLPKVYDSNKNINKIHLNTICKEYLNFSIVKNLLDTTLEQLSEEDLKEGSKQLLDLFNKHFIIDKITTVRNLQEMRDLLSTISDTYRLIYDDFVESGYLGNLFQKLPIRYMYLNRFIRRYKDMINNNSHIGIVIDYQEPIALKSQQAVNNFIASRINADISIKVACEENKWDTFYDLDGTHIDYIHDYGEVYLDDNYRIITKKLFKNY